MDGRASYSFLRERSGRCQPLDTAEERLQQEVAGGGDASSEYQQLRLEQPPEVDDGDREVRSRVAQHVLGERVAGPSGVNNRLGVDGATAERPHPGCDRRAGREHLEAARAAAAAARSGGVDDHVTDLGAAAVGASEQRAIDHDAATDARADGHADVRAAGGGGTEPAFGQRRTVGVVADDRLQAGPARHDFGERGSLPRQVRRHDGRTRVCFDDAGYGQTDTAHGAFGLRQQILDECHQLVQEWFEAVAGCRHGPHVAHLTPGRDESPGDLATAQVDGEQRRAHLRAPGFPTLTVPKGCRMPSLRCDCGLRAHQQVLADLVDALDDVINLVFR